MEAYRRSFKCPPITLIGGQQWHVVLQLPGGRIRLTAVLKVGRLHRPTIRDGQLGLRKWLPFVVPNPGRKLVFSRQPSSSSILSSLLSNLQVVFKFHFISIHLSCQLFDNLTSQIRWTLTLLPKYLGLTWSPSQLPPVKSLASSTLLPTIG